MDNKAKFIIIGAIGGWLFLWALIWHEFHHDSNAATITTGYTFTSGETNITHTKLNNAINNATISGITSADLQDGSVTSAKLAAGAVSGISLGTNVVTGGVSGNLALNTVTTTNMANNTLLGVEFATNFNFPVNCTVGFTNSGVTLALKTSAVTSAAVLGTNRSTGATEAGLVPKLDTRGKLDPSMLYAETNKNTVISADTATTATWGTLATATSSITNGFVQVLAVACFDGTGGGSDPGPISIRIRDATTNFTKSTVEDSDTGGNMTTRQMTLIGTDTNFSGSTKTYTLEGVVKVINASDRWKKSGAPSGGGATGIITDGCEIMLIEHPRTP